MGKRSSFKRIDKDHYPTIDTRAIPPLLPHLGGRVRYAEPMAGEGHLIDLLAPHADLVWASTIDPSPRPDIHENDVLCVGPGDAEMFITNPAWKRPLLHKVIIHLSDQLPTWLLFDADWAHTKQARPFMVRCRKIVAVGRLRWMEDTKTSGKDNAAWYLFDRPLAGSTPQFFPADWTAPEGKRRAARICADCGVLIDRFGKWHLQTRQGVPSPVHRDCREPSGPSTGPAPTPLLDWIAESATESGDIEIPSFLRRLAK